MSPILKHARFDYHWTEIPNPYDHRKKINPLVDPKRWWHVELPKDRDERCKFCGRPRMSFKEDGPHCHGFSIHLTVCQKKFDNATRDGFEDEQSSLSKEHSLFPEDTVRRRLDFDPPRNGSYDTSSDVRKRVLSWAQGVPTVDNKSAGKLRAGEESHRASKRPCYGRTPSKDSESAHDAIESHTACAEQTRQLLKQLEEVRCENEKLSRTNEDLTNANRTLREDLEELSPRNLAMVASKNTCPEVWLIGWEEFDMLFDKLVSRKNICVCTTAESAHAALIGLALRLGDTDHEELIVPLNPKELEDQSFAMDIARAGYVEYITVRRQKLLESLSSQRWDHCDGLSDFD